MKNKSSIRLIAGEWRGRRLPVIEAEGLRPTKDAIRETLFNWLAPHLPNARCLDLYAGTGALGFEAASRYVKEVVLVEKNRAVAKQLESNARLLKAVNLNVVNLAAEQFTKLPNEPFDIVFLDPPFQLDDVASTVSDLIEDGCVHTSSVIYIEQDSAKGLPALPSGWFYHREKKMGQVVYGLACCEAAS